MFPDLKQALLSPNEVRRKRLIFGLLLALALGLPMLSAATWQAQREGYGVPVDSVALNFEWQGTDGQWHSLIEPEAQATYLFLGYLTCSDVCPVRLSQALEIDQRLQADDAALSRQVRFLFITLNPHHDTPELRHEVIDQHSSRLYSGQLKEVDRQRVQAQLQERVQSTEEGDVIGHAGHLYLLDASGKVRHVYPNLTLSNDNMMRDLEILLASQVQRTDV